MTRTTTPLKAIYTNLELTGMARNNSHFIFFPENMKATLVKGKKGLKSLINYHVIQHPIEYHGNQTYDARLAFLDIIIEGLECSRGSKNI